MEWTLGKYIQIVFDPQTPQSQLTILIQKVCSFYSISHESHTSRHFCQEAFSPHRNKNDTLEKHVLCWSIPVPTREEKSLHIQCFLKFDVFNGFNRFNACGMLFLRAFSIFYRSSFALFSSSIIVAQGVTKVFFAI